MKKWKPKEREQDKSWESDISLSRLEDNKGKKKKTYLRGRPVAGIFPLVRHWFNTEGPKAEELSKQGKKTGKAFLQWCRAFDPMSERYAYTDETADYVKRLMLRHKFKVLKVEKINPSETWLTVRATLDDVQKAVLVNNANAEVRVNPYMISYRPSEKGVTIIVAGCPAHDQVSHKGQRVFVAHFIDRRKQKKGDPEYVQAYVLPYGCLSDFEEISELFDGVDITDPKDGVDVQMGYDSSKSGEKMYSVKHVDRTPLTKTEMRETLGRFRVMLTKEQAKEIGMNKADLKDHRFRPKDGKFFADMNLDTLFGFASMDLMWKKEGDDYVSYKGWHVEGVPIAVKTIEEPLVNNIAQMYFPAEAKAIQDVLHRCKYLEETSDDDGDDEGDGDDDDFDDKLDDDDGWGSDSDDSDDDDDSDDSSDDDDSDDSDDDSDDDDSDDSGDDDSDDDDWDDEPTEKKGKGKKSNSDKSKGKKGNGKKGKKPNCPHPKSSFGNFIVGDKTCIRCKLSQRCSDASE